MNQVARGNRRRPLPTDELSRMLEGRASVFVTDTVAAVPDAVRAILDRGCDLVAVCGGDGTLHLAMTEMWAASSQGRLPTMLVLRGGTMNIAAGNLGTGRRPARDLIALGHALRTGAFEDGRAGVRRVTPLRVEADCLDRPVLAFVFANGIAFRILREYYAAGEPSVARAFTVTTTVLGAAFVSGDAERRFFPSIPARVLVDGEVGPESPLRISVATPLPRLILWFTPFDEAAGPLVGGFFFLANFMRTAEIARHFWPLCRGTYEGPGHVCRVARDVVVEGGGGFTLDGEVYDVPGDGRVRISPGPEMEFLDLSGVRAGRTARWG